MRASQKDLMVSPEQYHPSPDKELSPEQIAAIEAGPGFVTNPAGPFLAPVSELGHLNNFFMYFAGPETFIGGIYHQLPYRQRFGILYPELTVELETHVASGYNPVGDISFMETPTGRLFATAYDLMRDQVDVADPGVLENGQVRRYLLWG